MQDSSTVASLLAKATTDKDLTKGIKPSNVISMPTLSANVRLGISASMRVEKVDKIAFVVHAIDGKKSALVCIGSKEKAKGPKNKQENVPSN